MNVATTTTATKSTHWRSRIEGSEFKIMRLQETPSTELLDTPERIVDYLRPKLPSSLRYSPDVENFGLVCLNTRRRAIGFAIISSGTLDTLLIHAREVFKTAIVMNSSALVLFHNHPSGDPAPSEADIKVTRDLIRAGQLLRIEVLDHVILGDPTIGGSKGWSSLRELGFFS